MAFTVGNIAAKDGASASIGGGLLAADVAGGGVGPWFLFNGLVDGVAGSNKAQIDSSNRLAVQVGASATAIAKAEDVASADADVGVPAMAVRKATPANTSGTDGDYEFLQISAGRLWTNSLIGDGTNTLTLVQDTAGTNVWAVPVMIHPDSSGILATGTQVSPSASYLSSVVAGDIAHDGVDSGNPLKIGGIARSSEPTAVSNADRAQLYTDLAGKLIVLPYANPENFVSGAITSAMTGTTSTSLVAAPAAGLRNYITSIICSNAHATVGTDIVIQDGSGGTTLLTIPAAAVYGGAVIPLPTPLRQPTTATALYCANVTTGASTKVSAVGYKGA